MAAETVADSASVLAAQIPVQPVQRPLDLIPVGLKEAALDSPTFRAAALHFSDQVDLLEKWLEGYVRQASKLASEVGALEGMVNSLIAASMPSGQIGEAVMDHDYALLAVRRCGEAVREFWQSTLRGAKRYEQLVVDPLRNFLSNELRGFKESRRQLEANQRAFDNVLIRYMGQSKNKEPSSLREDAFQLHEARKSYLKASMDFCIAAPQLRSNLDRLLVRIFVEQWKDMRSTRDANAAMLAGHAPEMDRVKGWSRELEHSERAFKRELLTARQRIEDSALTMTKPSREMDDYAASTVQYLGGAIPATATSADRADKQSWLFMRTVTGKPARTLWSRRWFFVKSGIFGWLMQGTRSGGVEESEKIGVLLCGVRPWFQEERRFCFEVKTKDTSIILQAETQQELTEWIAAFEVAKRKALEDPSSTETAAQTTVLDPAFAINPPIAPELAAVPGEGHAHDDSSGSLAVGEPGTPGLNLSNAPETSQPRRNYGSEKDAESTRDHASRLMSKLDLHKKTTPASVPSPLAGPSGGIASLISASHNILPVVPGAPVIQTSEMLKRGAQMPASTLAPSTLINPPASTNLSHTAVVLSGERNLGLARIRGTGTPSGLMANTWGSHYWGHVSHVDDEARQDRSRSPSQSAIVPDRTKAVTQDDLSILEEANAGSLTQAPESLTGSDLASLKHRKTFSVSNDDTLAATIPSDSNAYPHNYPLPLKAQQAQFRLLFPSTSTEEKLVAVFRATWSPNEQQEFPGRVYVTARKLYFFSNHLGLILITGTELSAIDEVTSAPGRDCDYLYLHLREEKRNTESRRVTVKVFLEPLRLLQRRLNYLVRNAASDNPDHFEQIITTLLKMEKSDHKRDSSGDSWEDLTYDAPKSGQGVGPETANESSSPVRNFKAPLRIDGALYGDLAKTGREVQKFRLPARPVTYVPQDMQTSVARDFSVSAKALFHVMFGDKSAVFQLVFANRWGDQVEQSAWVKEPPSQCWRRRFSSQGHATPLADTQTIDVMNDHLCYVITNIKDPWRLPCADRFKLTTKFVITHTTKSHSKLAIFQKVNWTGSPPLGYVRRLVEREALASLDADALDLSNITMDQVAKLGHHSRTIRAVEIFGSLGKQAAVSSIDAKAVSSLTTAMQGTHHGLQKPMTLGRLILDDVLVKALGFFGRLVDVGAAVCKSALNMCTMHSVLLAMLTLSLAYNAWYSYRDGVSWYQERRAGHFMNRLGVHPDPILRKAVFLKDIEELVAPSLPAEILNQSDWVASSATETAGGLGKTCRSTFFEQVVDVDREWTGLALSAPSQQRFQGAMDSLARYRHDLLVALRIVNRVERDVVLSEWETWVRGEGRFCDRVDAMLQLQQQEPQRQAGNSNVSNDRRVVQVQDLGEVAHYCNSCRDELERIDVHEKVRLL